MAKTYFKNLLPGAVGRKGLSGALFSTGFGGKKPGKIGGLVGGFCGDILDGDASGAAALREEQNKIREVVMLQPYKKGIVNRYLEILDWDTPHDEIFY